MKFRDGIFWFHLICGLIVGCIVMIMSVTGVILAFEPQIVEYAERGVRNIDLPSDGRNRLSIDEIVSITSEAQSGAKPSTVIVKSDPRSSVFVGFGRDGGLYVNPYTGKILGPGSKVHDWMHDVETWHRWLGIKEGKWKNVTHQVKGVCNIAFFFLIVTGFYLWWPKSWSWPGIKNIIIFNPQARGKARDWNWHNVIGFWCAPLLIVTTLTGVIMSYRWANDLLYRMTGNEPPVVQSEAKTEKTSGEMKRSDRLDKVSEQEKQNPVSLDVLLAQAEKQTPDWVAITLRLSGGQGQQQKVGKNINVTILEKEPANLKPRTQLTLDKFTGDVIKTEPFSEQNLGRRLRIWARYLHTGEALGIAGQLFMGLSAAGASLLVWTGFAMAWQRFFPANAKARTRSRK